MEWALWRAFMLARSPGAGPPPIFKTRVKRLLDIDRESSPIEMGPPAPVRFAFLEPVEGGRGVEAAYTPLDAFCLAVALDLLDVGFKQGEIVFLMRYLRVTLERWLPRLLDRPSLIDRQITLAKLFPHLPAIDRGDRRAPVADARVFLLLHRIELTEMLPARPAPRPKRGATAPVFLEPEICEGVAALAARLDQLMPLHRRTLTTLEIAAQAQAVTAFLASAPAIARGRPKSPDGNRS